MFVIVTYDVNRRRGPKVLKVCKKYLAHTQKSVFEGNLTRKQLDKMEKELKNVIDSSSDQIMIYCLESTKYTWKEQIGSITSNDTIL